MGYAKVFEVDERWREVVASLIVENGILDEEAEARIFTAFGALSRRYFVEDIYSETVYHDEPIPVGYAQWLSRPSLLIRMASLIDAQRGERILEVGCGSGYFAAVLSLAGAQVYATELIGPLAQRTRKRLDRLGFSNVIVHRTDGRFGWSEHAPFDAIVISTPVEFVSSELLEQLQNPGGRLVAPMATDDGIRLVLWEAKPEGLRQLPLEIVDVE